MGRSTKRMARAREMARAALTWAPSAPAPAAALRELVEAVAEGWFERSRADAILSLLDDRDRDFADLLLLGAGIGLDPLPPAPDKHAALAEVSIWTGPRRPDDLPRLIRCHALVRFGGDRRAAFRALVEQREGTLVAVLKRTVGIDLA